MEGNDSVVMETGLYNLTNDELPVLVHFGPDRQEPRTLIRLKQPEEQAQPPRNNCRQRPSNRRRRSCSRSISMPKLQVENVTKQYATRAAAAGRAPRRVARARSGPEPGDPGPQRFGQEHALEHHRHAGKPDERPRDAGWRRSDCAGRAGLAAFRSRRIGFVFQDHYLLPQCSVLENVLLPAVPLGRGQDATIRRAEMLLDRVGLAAPQQHRPAELSGGERQRAALGPSADQ